MNKGKLTLLCMFACKGDWNKELVPKDFVSNLFGHYRDYFDSEQKMKNGRQTSYTAFVYFVDRILPSINAEVTKYNRDVRYEVSMSSVRARYTDSTNGNIHAGWEQEGIKRFNVLARMIRDRRNDKVSNDNLDNTLRNVWRGMQKDTGSRRKPEEASMTEAAYEDE